MAAIQPQALPPIPLPLPPGPLPSAGWMLRELYRLRVQANPRREALRFRDRLVTHADLLERIDHTITALEAAAARIDPASANRVWASYGGDTEEHLVLYLSGFLSERPLLLLPLQAAEEELTSLLRRGTVGVVLSDRALPASLGMESRGAVAGAWTIWTAIDPPVAAGTDSRAGSQGPQVPSATMTAADQAQVILDRVVGLSWSSGTTTGIPAIQTARALDALAMLQHPEWPLSDRMLFTLRMQFSASRSWALRILMEGGTLCCLRVEEAPELPELAGQLEADTCSANPAFLERMLTAELASRFPGSLQFITGTDRVPVGLRHRFHERFGPRLTIALANSHLGPLTLLPADQLLAHDGEAVGYPLPNVHFDFAAGTNSPWQSQGLGEAVVSKTWRVHLHHPEHGAIDLERTEAESRPGDLLRRWPDGLLSFGGRANDVFLFRSLLISPHEIENVLAEDRAVAEAVAFGAPSSVYGAVPMAALRLHAGHDPEQELPRLRRHCQNLMGVKAPKALILLDEIPRGSTGKPLRRELARLHALT